MQALATAGSLNNGQANALTSPLQKAENYLSAGNAKGAINQLQAFISNAKLLISGVLTSAQGQPLIDAANAVILSLGG